MNRKYSSNPSAAAVLSKDIDFGTSTDIKKEEMLSELVLDDVHVKHEPREGHLENGEIYDAADAAQAEISKSLYVIKLSEMIRTVLEHEAHLFTTAEVKILHTLLRIEYESQFLTSRIALRKQGKWHRFDHLLASYTPEFTKYMNVPELNVPKVMAETLSKLCAYSRAREQPFVPVDQKEVIDLTLDSDDEGADGLGPSASSASKTASVVTPAPALDGDSDLVDLMDDPSSASPTELLECLTGDELKVVAKKLKVSGKGKSTRADLIKAILHSTSTQTTLPFAVVSKSLASPSAAKSKNNWKQFFALNPHGSCGKKQNMPLQERRVREMCHDTYGACFRLRDEVLQALRLTSVVYFRSVEYLESDSLMLSSILATTGKRTYPKYEYKRTTEVFETRADLLRYVETSQLLNQVDQTLEGLTQPPGAKFDRLKAAQEVVETWEAHWDRWNSLVAYLKDKSRRQRGLERFEEGYLLTRLVYKAVEAFARLQRYDMELKLLGALLRQTRWRQSKRGSWYDRIALIYTRYMGGGDDNLRKARDILLEGLNDKLVHIGSRPMLLRRLQRLEKQLRIPQGEQYVGEGELRTAALVQIEGTRVFVPTIPGPSSINVSILAVSSPIAPEKTPATKADYYTQISTPMLDKQKPPKWTGKSIWVGKEGDVNVETLALEHYASLGFRGFHSEGSIVSTLFGLLFWDILFAQVPGAFETPYQSAPMDLMHDSFFTSREDIINARLEELADDPNAACRIIEEVDVREREREPWCIGVRWEMFERGDLLEIADCLGGRALAAICRLLAEEYRNRQGGVPDLFIWNASEKKCKFVEVKGPGDSLSETQKVWIDVLLGAGVDVDVCRVYEHGKIPASRPAKGKKGHSKAPRRSTSRGHISKAARLKLEPADDETEDELWSSSDDDTSPVGPKRNIIGQSTSPPRTSVDAQDPDKRVSLDNAASRSKENHPPRVLTPSPCRTSPIKRSSFHAELDDTDQAPKKRKPGAIIVLSAGDFDIPAPSLQTPIQANHIHTATLRPITSLPAPVLPTEPMEPELGCLDVATKAGPASIQGTLMPEIPQSTAPCQPLAGCSSPAFDNVPSLDPASDLHTNAGAGLKTDPQPGPQTNRSPYIRRVRTNKQMRDMLHTTPAKKSRKKAPDPSPVKASPPRETTPKRTRKDSPTHTTAPNEASRPTAITAPRARPTDWRDDGAATARELRPRRSLANRHAEVAGNPVEWEKRWPGTFPKWEGDLTGANSDKDYEPSQ